MAVVMSSSPVPPPPDLLFGRNMLIALYITRGCWASNAIHDLSRLTRVTLTSRHHCKILLGSLQQSHAFLAGLPMRRQPGRHPDAVKLSTKCSIVIPRRFIIEAIAMSTGVASARSVAQ